MPVSSAQCVWRIGALLGEGTLWSPDEQAVWFVDIEGRALHRFVPATAAQTSWATPDRPTFVARTDSGLIIGLAKSLARFSPVDGLFEWICDVEIDRPDNRLNDGSVGPDGALWFGSKNDLDAAPTGQWFRWDGRSPPTSFDAGYVVTNGPAFSNAGDRVFFSDSLNRRIFYRSLETDGTLGPSQSFAQFDAADGYPDGLALDDEDCLWVALYGGHGLRRLSPAGATLAQVAMPCANPTKPAFGGPARRTLYVTSASEKPGSAQSDEAGGLFAIDVDVSGPAIPGMWDCQL